jgi:hypothetical protein
LSSIWEASAFAAGAALVVAGALSLLYPLRWIGIRTRAIAFVVIAAGFLVVALGAGMLDSYFVYFGFALAVVGLISVLRPLRFLYLGTRRLALVMVVFGILLSVATALIPYGEQKSATAATKLDEWMPRWQVDERHTIEIAAPPEKVFASIHAVRADEILLFRTLVAIRRCGTTGPESILNPPEEQPLLDVATRTSFILLTDDAPREIVVGTVIAAPREVRATGKLEPDLFRKNLRPGVALATMNFLVAPNRRAGSTVTTETRIYANTPAVLRRFGVYWRLIHPGSDLIRRMWLRAIAQRAEATPAR